MFNKIGQGIQKGINSVGQDLSFGAGLLADQKQMNQQYNQLVSPTVSAKKKSVAQKMPKPSFMQNLTSGVQRNLTSLGRNQQYLQ